MAAWAKSYGGFGVFLNFLYKAGQTPKPAVNQLAHGVLAQLPFCRHIPDPAALKVVGADGSLLARRQLFNHFSETGGLAGAGVCGFPALDYFLHRAFWRCQQLTQGQRLAAGLLVQPQGVSLGLLFSHFWLLHKVVT